MSTFQKEYDIVIIGSGAGGGTLAKELSPLCRQGLRIALLEWGPKFREEEFTGRELEMAGKLYFNGGGFLTKDGTMTLAFGRTYGGSTAVYTGTSLIIREETVERWEVPGISYEDLKRRSEKYLKENNVHLLEEDKINDNNRLFYEGCRNLGYRAEQFPINVKGCQGSGFCNLGCPNQAKQGTNRVQLPEAEKNGVEVITCCRADRIEENRVYATVVRFPYGIASPWEPGDYEIKARIVVTAGGAINSPALLLRSGFGRRLPALGRYFTGHPALILVGRHPHPITNFYGHPKSYFCDEFVSSHRFLLETCMYFPFTTAKSLIGFGPNHSEMMQSFDRLQMILLLSLDRARPENRVTIDSEGNPVVDYRLDSEVLDSLLEGMKVSAKIFFAAGATEVHAPAGRKFFIKASEASHLDELITRSELKPGKATISTAHLMGGCRMGKDPSDSVTNEWGQVHGVPWLFAADSSLFPHCAEINPYVTIMALADRVAEGIRNEILRR